MSPVNHENRVSRAALKSAQSQAMLHIVIREASSAGLSLREIARAAAMSHETVRKIVDPGQPRPPGT